MALLALPFGLAIGLSLGLVGGGGSILAVPVLVYVLGEPVKAATTESLLIVGATALLGALDHAGAGRVRWRVALAFGTAGAVGSLGGTELNRAVGSRSLLLAFAALLLVAATAMVRGRGEPRRVEIEPRGADLWLRVVPIGLATGVLTGFFGVGGGFVVVPALAILLGLPLRTAVGTSLAVISITSAAALAAHLAVARSPEGRIDWTVAGAFTGAAVAGALAGSRAGRRVPVHRLAHGFAALVVVVAGLLVAKNVVALV
jgi:uncharacterized membrane protein YfcA